MSAFQEAAQQIVEEEQQNLALEPEEVEEEEVGQQSEADAGDETDEAAEVAEDEGEDAGDIKALTELAESLEVDEADLLNLEVTYQKDGEQITRSIQSLIRQNQQSASEMDRRQVQQLSSQLQQQAQANVQQVQQALGVSHLVHQGMLDQINGQLNSPQMQEARTSNPEMYLQAKEALEAQRDAIQQQVGEAEQAYQQIIQQQAQQVQQAHGLAAQEFLSSGVDEGEFVKFVTDLGFSIEEMQTVTDPRIFHAFEDARKWRNQQAQLKTGKKGLRKKIPKLRKSREDRQAQTADARAARALDSGDTGSYFRHIAEKSVKRKG